MKKQYQRLVMMKEEKRLLMDGSLGQKGQASPEQEAAGLLQGSLVYVRASVLRTWHRYCEEGPYSVWAAAIGGLAAAGSAGGAL